MIVCFAAGARPWSDSGFEQGKFYAMVGFALSAAVFAAIVSEFYRGGRVISKQTGKNLLASTYLLCRRNTRRYGGYLVHIGLVIIIVGLCGAAFNRNEEKEMGLHDKLADRALRSGVHGLQPGLEPQL